MKIQMTLLVSLFIFIGCGYETQTNDNKQETKSVPPQSIDFLRTGWYYISDTGIEKALKGTEETFFINPNPIVTVDDFSEMEIYESNFGDFGLSIQLDKKGTEQWRIATGMSIDKKLALIISNELYSTPTINSQIDVGMTVLNRGDLSEEELKLIKQRIEQEKN